MPPNRVTLSLMRVRFMQLHPIALQKNLRSAICAVAVILLCNVYGQAVWADPLTAPAGGKTSAEQRECFSRPTKSCLLETALNLTNR